MEKELKNIFNTALIIYKSPTEHLDKVIFNLDVEYHPQSLPKVLGTPYEYSVLYDNYEIPVKHNGLPPPPTPRTMLN